MTGLCTAISCSGLVKPPLRLAVGEEISYALKRLRKTLTRFVMPNLSLTNVWDEAAIAERADELAAVANEVWAI